MKKVIFLLVTAAAIVSCGHSTNTEATNLDSTVITVDSTNVDSLSATLDTTKVADTTKK